MRLETPALSYSAHQGKEAALWKAQQGQKPKSFWLHAMQLAFLPPASSFLFWNTPSGSQQVPEHLNTTSFQQHFHLKFESTSPVKYLHCAGMVLICQWILASMQSSEETSHSKVRWEDQKRYLIYQVYPRKAYVRAMEEPDSLSSWEAHCKVSGRSFPQDVWNRWFNHIKFLVLPTWLNTCPLFLQQQQVPFTILGNNTCTTHYCSQGSAQVPCHRATFRCHSSANINSRTTVFTFPWHTEPVLPSLAIPVPQLEQNPSLGAQDKHSTLQGHLSDRHVLLRWTIHSLRGSSWQAGLATPCRDSSRNLPSLLRGNITGLLNCATRQMGCVLLMQLTRHRETSPIFLKIFGHLLLWPRCHFVTSVRPLLKTHPV